MRLFTLAICFIFSLCGAAQAGATLSGTARVHDGDTIRIGKQSIRIWGIDAVELKQMCGSIACGQMARDALARIIGDNTVVCEPRGQSYKRVVAKCVAGGRDIAAEMARIGMAYDYTHYSHGYYAGARARARKARIGVWAMSAEDPAHWRACNLPQRKAHRPGDCES